jgi:hypothetical protein
MLLEYIFWFPVELQWSLLDTAEYNTLTALDEDFKQF